MNTRTQKVLVRLSVTRFKWTSLRFGDRSHVMLTRVRPCIFVLLVPLFIFARRYDRTVVASSHIEVHKLRQQLEDLRHSVAGMLLPRESDIVQGFWNPRVNPGDKNVERRPYSKSFGPADFHEKYESKGRPLIVEAPSESPYWSSMGADYGDPAFWKIHCGDGPAAVRIKPPSGASFWSWPMVTIPLGKYIDFLRGEKSAQEAGFPDDHLKGNLTPDRTYLFDWQLSECPSPAILDDLVIPRIFSNDLLTMCYTNTTEPCPYNTGNWPSLFIGPSSIKGSPLHRDTFGSAFFSIQLRGKKRWRIFASEDAPFLYPSTETDVKFQVTDTFDDSNIAEKFPLVRVAGRADAVVGKNELLYIPGGSPHQVRMEFDESENEGDLGYGINIMLAMNFVSQANLDRVISTTAPQVANDFIFSQRLYAPLHGFFAIHKADLLKTIDWNIDHTPYRQFAGRRLPYVCMSHLAFSVDARPYQAEVNALHPNIAESAHHAAKLHPLVERLEESLKFALVKHLRRGANGDCKESMASLLNPELRKHQPLLSGFCPAYALQSDFMQVEELISRREARRLIVWATAQMERVRDSVDSSPPFTFDLARPSLNSLAEITAEASEKGSSIQLRRRFFKRLWPALSALPVASQDSRLKSRAWLDHLWEGELQSEVYGFVRLYSPETDKGLQLRRGGSTYSVNIALNDSREFEGGDLTLLLGGEAVGALTEAPFIVPRMRIGTGIVFGANVPHMVTDVLKGKRWFLVLHFRKLRDQDLPPCFKDFV